MKTRFVTCNGSFVTHFFLALLTIAMLPTALGAQTDGYLSQNNATGVIPFGSYFVGEVDNINLGNGAVNLNIPLWTRRGRGFDTGQRLIYSSKLWAMRSGTYDDNGVEKFVFIWEQGISGGGANGLAEARAVPPTGGRLRWNKEGHICEHLRVGCGGTCQIVDDVFVVWVFSNFTFEAADGSKYLFPNRNIYNDSVYPTNKCRLNIVEPKIDVGEDLLTAPSNSGTMELTTTIVEGTPNPEPEYELLFKDGRKIVNDLLTDSNGNLVGTRRGASYTDNSDGSRTYHVYDSDGGTPEDYTFHYEGRAVAPPFPNAFTQEGEPITFGVAGLTLLTRIDLPYDEIADRFYEFSYDLEDGTPNPGGELTKITLPAGGYVRYEYGTFAYFEIYNPNDVFERWIDARRVTKRCTSSDGATEECWTYFYPASNVTHVTDPEGTLSIHSFGPQGMHEVQTEIRDSAGTPLKLIQNGWAKDRGPIQGAGAMPLGGIRSSNSLGGFYKNDWRDWRLTGTTVTLLDTNQVSSGFSAYDSYTWQADGVSHPGTRMNVLERSESDFGVGAPGSLLRKTTFEYIHNAASGNSNYQEYFDRHIWDRVASQQIYDGADNLVAQTEFQYDSTPITNMPGAAYHDDVNYGTGFSFRGNMTAQRAWRDGPSVDWLTTSHEYDTLGNRIKSSDPMGHQTQFFYDDDWAEATCAPVIGSENLFPTRTVNHSGHEVTSVYFSCSGMIASATDANLQTFTITYDNLDRPLHETGPGGGVMDHIFNDQAHVYKQEVKIDPTQNIVKEYWYDGFGRVTEDELTDPDCGTGPVTVKTTYDKLARKQTATNPYCTTSDDTYGLTEFGYDTLGRVVIVAPPDATGKTYDPTTGQLIGAANAVTTVYAGNCVTVTDQAGKARKSCSDGLGRLTDVWEDPAGLNYQTHYQYDALDNLTKVEQYGDAPDPTEYRTRTFTYNSLSQLLSADNPESGAINYTYDNDGNLWTKTDARGIATYYAYDELHRLTGKSYSDPTTAVAYYYDGDAMSGTTAGPGTGGMTISGSVNFWWDYPEGCFVKSCANLVYDSGTVQMTVDSYSAIVSYGGGSTANSIASALASQFNSDPASPVTAVATTSNVTVTAKASGPTTNYPLSKNITSNEGMTSFTASQSSSTLTGGADDLPGCSLTLTINNPKGRRTGMCDESGATVWSYDVRGKVETEKKIIDGYPRFYDFTYDEGGNLKTVTDQGNWTETLHYNAASRMIKRTKPNGTTRIDKVEYAPHGAWDYLTNGSDNLSRSRSFNSRLQPTELIGEDLLPAPVEVMKLTYDFQEGVANNGNVYEVKDIHDLDPANHVTYTYTYDDLNRIKTADATGGASPWGLTYDYDAWGNFHDRTVTEGSAFTLDVTPTLKNQLSDPGYDYDLAGNMTEAPDPNPSLSYEYEYDAENRLVKVTQSATVLGEYTYDGDGNRVLKEVAGTKTIYFRNAATGNLRSEFSDSGSGYSLERNHLFFAGERYAVWVVSDNKLHVNFNDHLGSPRVRTRGVWGGPLEYTDYYPFGGTVDPPPATQDYLFTGQERDKETGLDYFIARHYGNNIGRFLQPDPYLPSAAVGDPQTWNRYAYARNNPLRYVDPSGLDFSDLSDEQRRAFDSFAGSVNEANGTTLSSEEIYNTLDASQMSTFEAITHALEQTTLTDSNGNSMGNALEQIESVTAITGEVDGAGGSKQFRLSVTLKEGAINTFEQSQEFGNAGWWGHVLLPNGKKVGLTGADSLRQEGKVPKIQVGFLESDNTIGDIDVDYRATGEGHLKPSNSDVRSNAGGKSNSKRHNRRFGKVKPLRIWWE